MAKAISSNQIQGPISAVNRFEGLDTQQDYNHDDLRSLNQWAHKVQQSSATKVSQKMRKKVNSLKDKQVSDQENAYDDHAIHLPGPNDHDIVVNSSKAAEKPIVVRNEKDLAKLTGKISALPTQPKEIAKVYKKISKLELQPGEKLCMVDSGSFIHAIDAENDLPDHKIHWFSDEESNKGVAETACGGILKRLGLVKCSGQVEGNEVTIQWNHMKVKCPILSVLRLTKNGNEVILRENGGEIINLETGKHIPFFQHNGVYYLKLKIHKPKNDTEDEKPVFSRRGA